jgi:hypothetical protein
MGNNIHLATGCRSAPKRSIVSRVHSRNPTLSTAEWAVQISASHSTIVRSKTASALELRTLQNLAETQGIDKLVTAIQAHQKEAYLNTHASQSSYHREPDLYVITFVPFGICIILYLVLHFSHPFLTAFLNRCKQRREPETGAPDSTGIPPAGVQPKPQQTTVEA